MPESQPFNLPGLPDEISPGEFKLVFMYDTDDGEPVPMEIEFTWDGGTTATWAQDIWWNAPNQSPASSASPYGWASWRNRKDVLIAYELPDLDLNGWARIEGGAPASDKDDPDDAMYEPETWVEFGKKIVAALRGNSLPGMTWQTY